MPLIAEVSEAGEVNGIDELDEEPLSRDIVEVGDVLARLVVLLLQQAVVFVEKLFETAYSNVVLELNPRPAAT